MGTRPRSVLHAVRLGRGSVLRAEILGQVSVLPSVRLVQECVLPSVSLGQEIPKTAPSLTIKALGHCIFIKKLFL